MILWRFFLIPLLLTIYGDPVIASENKTTKPLKQSKKTEPSLPFSFTPPKKWQCIADKEALPAKVMAIYIGTGKKGFTPSINIATEETEASLLEYINLAKQYHESQSETQCYNLGSYETKGGSLELLQIDKKTQWGNIRFLQGTLIAGKTAFVLTATCLEEEYSTYYPQFLQAFQSFNPKTTHLFSKKER